MVLRIVRLEEERRNVPHECPSGATWLIAKTFIFIFSSLHSSGVILRSDRAYLYRSLSSKIPFLLKSKIYCLKTFSNNPYFG